VKFFVKYFIFFFIIASGLQYSHSQQHKIDSLLSILKTLKEDTVKADILNRLSTAYRDISFEESRKYAQLAIDISWNLLYKKGLAVGYNKIGVLEDDASNYDTAIKYFNQALRHYEEINNKEGIAIALNNVGNSYRSKGIFDKGIEYYLKSLRIREEISDQKGIADSYNNIGNVYINQSKYKEALEYYHKSLAVANKNNYQSRIATAYVNLGRLYKETNKMDSALYYMNKSYSISIASGNKRVAAFTLINLATAYTELKDYSLAMKYYLQSMSLFKELGDKSAVAYCMGGLGEVYALKKDYVNALKYQDSCRQIAKEIGERDLLKETYLYISVTYDSLRDYKKAYEFHNLFSNLKDSLLNEESSKQIVEMQTKYETEKKEQQITLLNKDKELQDAQLNRQKIIIWSVASGLLVVLTLSIFIFRERRKSERLLLNILPAETARELKKKGKASPRHCESVTVMFTDFKGFTNIAEKLSAEELVSELDFLFRKFDEIISQYPIEKIKTIGDAYMCAGGLPTANTTNAMDVVSAALEIQNWMTVQNSKWNLRIGIHTGAVTAGVVGDKKFAYDIWGDTVNTASRMESSGEAGKINISGVTHQLIKEQFNCEFRGKIPAKNKGEIEMYFVQKV